MVSSIIFSVATRVITARIIASLVIITTEMPRKNVWKKSEFLFYSMNNVRPPRAHAISSCIGFYRAAQKMHDAAAAAARE